MQQDGGGTALAGGGLAAIREACRIQRRRGRRKRRTKRTGSDRMNRLVNPFLVCVRSVRLLFVYIFPVKITIEIC